MQTDVKDPIEGSEALSFMEKLVQIQERIKISKTEYSEFGNYHYRTTEGILGALKPLLKEFGLIVNLSDELVEMGVHRYVKGTATLYDMNGSKFSSVGFAREAEARPKFDPSQLTGSASSYARKYALQGLLALDSTDADSENNGNKLDKDGVRKMVLGASNLQVLKDLEKEIILYGLQEEANERWKQLKN